MILPGISLARVDDIYQRMGIKELVVIPWFEFEPAREVDPYREVGMNLYYDGGVTKTLSGLITGYIDEYPAFPGSKSAFLEHFIVLPEAPNKLRVMQQMPKLAKTLLAGKVERILLCIAHDERRRGLGAWARRCGYTKFGELDSFDWYVQPLTGESHGKERSEDARAGAGDPAPAAAPSP